MPASIAAAAICMPLMNPRQALPTSKFRQLGGSSRWWCTAQATDGSRWCLHTEVEMSMPIRLGSMPAASIALRPAHRRGLVERDIFWPPTAGFDPCEARPACPA